MKELTEDSLMVQWLTLHVPKAGAPGFIPGQGTRSYMLQPSICKPQLRPSTAKYIFFKKERADSKAFLKHKM